MEAQKSIIELFEDVQIIEKINKKLPTLFHIAELECSRAGKIGMEVGSMRERIIVALLIYKFGDKNIETEIPITEAEVDVKLFQKPISIKTITGRQFSGVKLIWTVDASKAREFRENYYPICDIILVRINWGNTGGLYYIPLQSQITVFNEIGRENYIKLPKENTNPRGVEFNKNALERLISEKESKSIQINWQKTDVDFAPFERWVDLWKED